MYAIRSYYANSMKTEYLGVPREILETKGAVSRETAEAMAAGMRSRSGADIGLAVRNNFV